MAQKEMMLRLIKDGKIVGERWFVTIGFIRKHKELFYDSLIDELEVISDESLILDVTKGVGDMLWSASFIPHDSFEFGIKVGDDWWFEGDKGHFFEDHGHGRFVEFDFVLHWNGSIWYTEPDNPYMPRWIVKCLEHSKRIGNIHK